MTKDLQGINFKDEDDAMQLVEGKYWSLDQIAPVLAVWV